MNTPIVQGVLDYKTLRSGLARRLLEEPLFDRGSVHAQKITDEMMHTRELRYVNFAIQVPSNQEVLAVMVNPNLPWAEDHFQERVCGEPLNPPPSNEWWPFAQRGNEVHKKDEKFSHTYPERFWPKFAGENNGGDLVSNPRRGIRFVYGDYADLVELLINDPRTRQAYLPIWFPEDLGAAVQGERVPCTLGYHFMVDDRGRLNLAYPMRSCDFLRFMPDDIYMAGRLLQHTVEQTGTLFKVGTLHMNISSLHAFKGDQYRLELIRDGQAN